MSDDTIKRSDAIKALDNAWINGTSLLDANEAVKQLKDLPSADRPQGEWILECDGEGECDNLYRCSECGCEYGCQEYDIPNFCPNCGARMKTADERDYERAIEQMQYDMLYEPTYNPEDGSM